MLPDLVRPPIDTAPRPGSYLVTGLPRMRSAWLAAVLATEEVPCFHEDVHEHAKHMPFGLCDPGAACTYPQRALELWRDRKVVVVVRDEAEARVSFELWAEQKTDWSVLSDRYQWFFQNVHRPFLVYYKHLAEYPVMAALYEQVTGQKLSRTRWHLFEGLNVQQHKPTARERFALRS